MNTRILFVDDDPIVLRSIKRGLQEQFIVETALGPQEGLKMVSESGPFAVVVSDMHMPEMDGIVFLSRIQELSPETIRIMLTGNADLGTAVSAVNEGNIFRFLTKPCAPETMAKTLSAAVDQHQLVTAEKELLEQTVRGCVQVLSEILALVNPLAFGRTARLRNLVREISHRLDIEDSWQLDVAVMLSQIGCVTVPEPTLQKRYRGKTLTAEEKDLVDRQSEIGQRLIARIPRFEEAAEIIAYQEKCYDGSGYPSDELAGENIPLGARILKAAMDFDTLESLGNDGQSCCNILAQTVGLYDPNVLSALKELIKSRRQSTEEVGLFDLVDGMVLAEEIRTEDGMLIVGKGQEVTISLRARLRNFHLHTRICEPLLVCR